MQENFSLKPYNTFGVDAKARYFTEINTIDELKEALIFADTQSLPLLF